jgi:hypothetical protein
MDLPGNMIQNMHQAPQMHPGAMHPSGAVSEYGPQSTAMRTTMQQAGAHWNQTIGGSFRSFNSPPAPGLTLSNSCTNTAQTEYPSPPLAYFGGAPPPLAGVGCTATTSAGPMMGSDQKLATSPLDTQLVASSSQNQLEIHLPSSGSDIGGSQDPLAFWAQQSSFDLNEAPIQSFDDYKPTLDVNGPFTQSNHQSLAQYTTKE